MNILSNIFGWIWVLFFITGVFTLILAILVIEGEKLKKEKENHDR